MRWENDARDPPATGETQIPTRLLAGLERLAAAGDLLKARLRWRPRQTPATGFLTHDRLLDLHGEPIVEIARALASRARGLHQQRRCESTFEAQVQLEFDPAGLDGRRAREWRSITFDVRRDEHGSAARSARTRPPSSIPTPADYAPLLELRRTEPHLFALVLALRAGDRTVSTLERLTHSTIARLDSTLEQHVARSRYLNDALQTLTEGARDIAAIGVDVFHQAIEGRARIARMEAETELDRERSQIMRDALQHASPLVQALLMRGYFGDSDDSTVA